MGRRPILLGLPRKPKRNKTISVFGWNICVRLKELRWTQSDLAQVVGTTRQSVSYVLRARRPWLETVVLYAEALRVTPSRLDPSFPNRVREARARAGLPVARDQRRGT